jgi:hypothetical protein
MDFDIELKNIQFVDDEVDMEMLYGFMDRLEVLPNQREAIPSIFIFIEKNYDKELGSPGPLVHFMEEKDDYHQDLKRSIQRKPTALTVWMVNRILNGVSENEREEWVAQLQSVSNHKEADIIAKDSAKEFLEQRGEI